MFKSFSDTRIIGKRLIYLPKCHSTNDIAASMIREGNIEEGTIIITDHQYAGRGQRGNTWESETGENLTFSVILHPGFLKAEDNFFLNIAITLGIYDGLANHCNENLFIKWPNDIYYSNRKLGGILIENTIQSSFIEHTIAGVGINVNQEKFEVKKAISLKQILHFQLDCEEVLNGIVHGIDSRYDQLCGKEYELLKKKYLSVLLGYSISRRFRAATEFEGKITGIDEMGRLLVESGLTVTAYDLKEIEFLDE